MKSIRQWLAPVLTIVLLIAHGAVQRQADYAIAGNVPAELAASQQVVPALSIVEAKDLLGQTVTIRATIAGQPVVQPDGSYRVLVEDETGTLELSADALQLRPGDVVQITGRIGGSFQDTLLQTSSAGIVPVR
ncbi:hypothetical protein [Paenibacillus flagellatus]|uniref:Uncharacterized protein n=1 Tax=Paenibacillus flagellatus TaxID=2211139 RepID=A0A2V5KEV6_9BACL|nr:hypothetical protein [Paenibacillus flagellatus]PYI52560.1 hypothetical protein DLM86_20520 [Paenibacillus flagellatus]